MAFVPSITTLHAPHRRFADGGGSSLARRCMRRRGHGVVQVRMTSSWGGEGSAGGGSPGAAPNGEWRSSSTTGVGSGHMETLEYTIHADGRVEQKISGVKGSKCYDITKAIEENLGEVVHQENTAEFFERPTNAFVDDQVSDELPAW